MHHKMNGKLQEPMKPVRSDKRDPKAVFISSFVDNMLWSHYFQAKRRYIAWTRRVMEQEQEQ